jgi:hypothetical protein
MTVVHYEGARTALSSLINNTDGTLVSAIRFYFIRHKVSLVPCLTFLRQGLFASLRCHSNDVEGAFSWLFHLKRAPALIFRIESPGSRNRNQFVFDFLFYYFC